MIEAIVSFCGAASITMAVGLVFYFRQSDLRTKRALRRIKKTLVRDVVDGRVVKIIGTIEWAKPRQAALTRRSCAYFNVTVGDPMLRARIEGGGEFIVRDESGAVRVSALEHVESVLDPEDGYVADETKTRFLENNDVGPVAWKGAIVEERIIRVGDRVMVAGVARWEAAPEDAGSFRETGRMLTMEGSEAVPLLIGNWTK